MFNDLLCAVHDGKCLVTWDGNECGVLWERLWKWSEEGGYQGKTCASGLFTGWDTYDSADEFLKALNKDSSEHKFRGT